MPNSAQHLAIGAVAGTGTYLLMCRYYNRKVDLAEALVCAGAGMAGAALPDLLEPALHPHHRKIAHSITAGGALTKFSLDRCASANGEWTEFGKIVFASAGAGYISHLVADGCTPRGLPML